MNSIPLVKGNTPQEINTSIIALRKALNNISGGSDESIQEQIQQINNMIEIINSEIAELQPVDLVQSGNMNSVTSNAVYQELLNYDKYAEIKTDGADKIFRIGWTQQRQNWQSFTNIRLRGGRVDGWYGEGHLFIGNDSWIAGLLLRPMSNISIKVAFENDQYFIYAVMATYSRLRINIADESYFNLDIQEVSQVSGTLAWDDSWETFVTSANIGSQSVNYANNANYANSAGSATTAGSATSADFANYATSAGSANITPAISYTGTGNGCITSAQTADTYYGSPAGWASYLIFNHGDGSNYYHQMIRMQFWNVPQYQRMEGGALSGWKDFITSENIGSQSVARSTNSNGADSSFIVNADNSQGNFDEGIRINQATNGYATLLIGANHGTTYGSEGGFWIGVNRGVYGNRLYLNWNDAGQPSYFSANSDGTVTWVGNVNGTASGLPNEYTQPTAYASGTLKTKAFYFPAGTPEGDVFYEIINFCNYWLDNYYPVEWGYKNENDRIQAIARIWMNGSRTEMHFDDTGGGNVQSIASGSIRPIPYPIVLRLTRLN